MDNTKKLSILSLCTGYGGLELGLSKALENPLRVIAVEIEAFALANLVAKSEKGKMDIEAMWPNLKTFPAKKFRGCFDIITAGYPCQPFSHAGKRKGKEDPRHLWPYIEKIIAETRPVYGFFENVSGHLTLGFPDVYKSLQNLGYSVEAGLFTAAECGASHRRQRLFILAHSDSNERRPDEGEPNTGSDGRHDIGWCGEIDRWPARPGQPQYEWEEPRTIVGNAQSKRKLSGGSSGEGVSPELLANGALHPRVLPGFQGVRGGTAPAVGLG